MRALEPTPGAPPHAFWCRVPSRPNFGDALTPWLVQRLCGHAPRFAPHDDPAPRYFVTGSVAGLAGPGAIVWGTGLMWRDEPLSPAATWLAVRGPLTRARALACGAACPPVWGDPALLLPRLLAPASGPRCGIGFVPHFSDRLRLGDGWAAARALTLIDIQGDVESVVRAITSCEWVLSSSLHGLVVAHAYGIPAVHVRFRDLPTGDGVKFEDHFAALDVDAPRPHTLAHDAAVHLRALEHAAWAPATVDTEPLWQARPFRHVDA